MFAFRNLPKLKTLIINNNPKLVELEGHAFGSLRNLNFLSLSYNQLNVIDGYIFSSSTSIKTIDFIGNPIKKIKSCAFHGLRNVSELLLSLNQNVTPIEIIEGDSFISTAFVDQIFLQGIPAKNLSKHAFRGLSYCKNLYLSNTHMASFYFDSYEIKCILNEKTGCKYIFIFIYIFISIYIFQQYLLTNKTKENFSKVNDEQSCVNVDKEEQADIGIDFVESDDNEIT